MLIKLASIAVAALASSTLASPSARASEAHAAANLPKRFAPGNCGIHVKQERDTNHWYNKFTVTVKDNDGNTVGDDCSAYSINTTEPDEDIYPTDGQLTCQREGMPFPLSCTIQPDAQDWSCTYESGPNPYTFGTANGCGVGDWDGPDRQADCGFAC